MDEQGTIVENKRGQKQIEFQSGEKYDCCNYVGETRVGWICSTDFQDEIGNHSVLRKSTDRKNTETVPEGNKIYDSLEELKQAKPCVKECGYTKVLIVAIELGKV